MRELLYRQTVIMNDLELLSFIFLSQSPLKSCVLIYSIMAVQEDKLLIERGYVRANNEKNVNLLYFMHKYFDKLGLNFCFLRLLMLTYNK